MDIGYQDFKFLKDKIKADRDYHETNFLQRIDPDLIDAYFEGDPDNAWKSDDNSIYRMTYQRLFPATTTLIPQLYPVNPKFVCTGRDTSNELDAKVAQAAMNYYFEQMGAKTENQKAIMSAWLYGYGVTKQGWRTIFKQNAPSNVDTNAKEGYLKKAMNFITGKPSMEEDDTPSYVASESPFLNFVNCKDIYLDKDEPYGMGKYFTQKLCRSLYDIRTSGLYTLPEEFYTKFKRSKDEREVKLDLFEQWCWNDGLWVFVYTEGWDKPLRYDKMPYAEGFPFKVLSFTTQVNELYPVSHMKVAQRQQRLADYILTLQKEHIEKYKDLTVFSGDAFDADDKTAIRTNRIGTNVYTKKGFPAASAVAHVGGNAIPTELFKLQDTLDASMREILSVVGARGSGQSEYDTATQEKIADFGNQLRSIGLQDAIKDWNKAQGKKLLQDIKQFDTAPHILRVTGLNIQDPKTGEVVTEKWVEFGTYNSPKTLKDVIPADLDIEVDITEFARRDLPLLRKQLDEFIKGTIIPLIPTLQSQGKIFDAVEYIKDAAKNFETLQNPEKYLKDIPQPVAAPIAPMAGPTAPNTAVPEAPIQPNRAILPGVTV